VPRKRILNLEWIPLRATCLVGNRAHARKERLQRDVRQRVGESREHFIALPDTFGGCLAEHA